MKGRVLIVTPDRAAGERQSRFLIDNGILSDVVNDGESAQVALSKESYQNIFIDAEATDNSCLELIRFIQERVTDLAVFLTYIEEKKFKDLGVTEVDLKNLGVKKILLSPQPLDLFNAMKSDEQETTIEDSEFTRINVDEILHDSFAIIDFYIRLGANRYVKFIHKADATSQEQIQKYSDGGAKYFYFLNKDRAAFISNQNNMASRVIEEESLPTAKIVKALKAVTDKYIEEVYVEGLKADLIEEGKSICQNMFNLIQKDEELKNLLGNIEEFSPIHYSHSFLVCFFTTVISKNLNWVGAATQEALSIGAIFHDIGMLQLPEKIRNKNVNALTADEFLLYKEHPNLGREKLDNISMVNNMVKEIVLQHHETIDGKGFPFGLTGMKIYPLAKVVGLADAFTYLLVEKRISPKEGIKEFLSVRENLVKYDSELVKSLVKGFFPVR